MKHGLDCARLVRDAFLLVQVSCFTAHPANSALFVVRPGCRIQLWVSFRSASAVAATVEREKVP
jgi:hypothetical protein